MRERERNRRSEEEEESRERGTEREGEREIEPGRRGAVLPVAGYRSPRNAMLRLMYSSLWPAAPALRR